MQKCDIIRREQDLRHRDVGARRSYNANIQRQRRLKRSFQRSFYMQALVQTYGGSSGVGIPRLQHLLKRHLRRTLEDATALV